MFKAICREILWLVHDTIVHPVCALLFVASGFGAIGPVANAAKWLHDTISPAPEVTDNGH